MDATDHPPTAREKLCACCGEAFTCIPGGCWCDKVALTETTRAALRVRYDDCLCVVCINLHVKADAGAAASLGR